MFNRPRKTIRVFNEIAKLKPKELFFISDGARKNRKSDVQLIEECRELPKLVDWNCEVHMKFSDFNLGCRKSVSDGLDWVFSISEQAIILEDDCIPSQEFFWFCKELLDKYKDDSRVGSIGGTTFNQTSLIPTDSYYFSKYPNVWGWATWRRSWEKYRSDLKTWDMAHLVNLVNINTTSPCARRFWLSKFKMVRDGRIDTWDYQLLFHHWNNQLLSVIPKVNLVTNIGFDGEATHTFNVNHPYAAIEIGRLNLPLVHPQDVTPSTQLDEIADKSRFCTSRFRLACAWTIGILPNRLAETLSKLFAKTVSGRKRKSLKV